MPTAWRKGSFDRYEEVHLYVLTTDRNVLFVAARHEGDLRRCSCRRRRGRMRYRGRDSRCWHMRRT